MIDLLIVLAFVAYAVSAGFHARRQASRSLQEYFLAGKTLTGWKAGVSMAATQYGADTPLLVTGLIATGGIFVVWRLWIYAVAFLLMGFVFAVGWRRAGVLTDAELTEIRYSGPGVLLLRVLKAVYFGTIINCVVMAMVLVAALRIAEVFLPWHTWLPVRFYQGLIGTVGALGISLTSGATDLAPAVATTNNTLSILALVGFTTLYSMTGGLRSVVATDIVQLSMAMGGTLLYACIVWYHVGGFGALTEQLVELYGAEAASSMLSFAPPGGEMLLPFLAIIGMQWFFQVNSDGSGYLAQRAMACATDRDARIASLVFTWVQIVARSLLWLVIGVGLLVIYPFAPFTPNLSSDAAFTTSREILFVTGINDLLPVGIRGVMFVGLLAALASTIDTHLNWGASYWSNDIYQRLICHHWLRRKPDNHELVVVARLSNVLILVIALTLMAHLGSIQQAWFVSLLFGAGVGSVLVLRWLWERITLFSELAAMAVSLVVAPILLITTDAEWLHLAVMGVVSTGVAIGITYVTPGTADDVLNRFYQQVRPMGFWSNTARRMGDPPQLPVRQLGQALKITLLLALSVFLTLIGLGKLMMRLPGESSLWAWTALGIAVGLIPLWWRDAVSPRLTHITRQNRPL